MFKPYRINNQEWIKGYTQLFQSVRNIIDYQGMLVDSFQVMQNENLKAMDAIHVALAKHYVCEAFVTTDPDFKHLQSIQPVFIDLSNV